MNSPLVSIIIPVYNDQIGLSRCIKAIVLQSYPLNRLEVIVVDNGSVPPINVEKRSDLSIKLIRCEQPGSYVARNAGVKIATGEVFAFTDADCWPDVNWIKSGVETLTNHGGQVFVGGEVEMVKPSNPSAVALYQHAIGFGQATNIENKQFTGTLNLFCTQTMFCAVGCFEERLLSGGDREWSWRALRKGFALIYEPKAVIFTEPRISLRGAILQARRITAGRKMLHELDLAHMGNKNIAKQRTAWQSVVWIFSQKELTIVDRTRVFSVALIIRLTESLEHIRLVFGGKAERR